MTSDHHHDGDEDHGRHDHGRHVHGGRHDHQHGHQHGHANDRGVRGTLRYLRWLPQLWHSDIDDAVVALAAPRRGERCADIGAGLGAGVMPAVAAGAHVVAVEPTPMLRRLLRVRRALSRRRKLISVVDGAAEQIPAGDGSIDAVWAVNTMHHWVDVERAAGEIARVLRTGGRVVLVDEDFADPSHPDHDRFGDHGGPEQHGFTMVDADRMGDLLHAAGLTDVDASNRTLDGRPVVAVTAVRS